MPRTKEQIAEYNRQYRAKNRERLLAQGKERRDKVKEEFNAERRRRRAEDPDYRERMNAQRRKSHAKHRKKRNAEVRKNYHANATEINKARKEYFAKYREENREACRERQRPHYRKNKAKRRAALLNRTPEWADQEAIKFFYECCPAGCHVDHIFPLRGKVVSGLHIAENLQWLPEVENLRKGNSVPLNA